VKRRQKITALLYLFFSLCTSTLMASTSPAVSTQDYFFRADYFSFNVSNHKSNLGLMGLHVAKKFPSDFYASIGIYSAVSGSYGGFFALGGEGGWQHLIYRNLGINTGIFLGAGGGKNTADQIGNGGFILPHVGLYYHFPYFNLGANYSYIYFQGGKAHSQQLLLAFDLPFQFFTRNPASDYNQPINFDWTKNYIAAVGALYHPNDSQFTDGKSLKNNTELLGIEFGHFLSKHFYNYFEFTGAIHGNQNGYANLFAGLGWAQFIAQSPFFYTGRFALGSGGGGHYDTGSGFLVYPSLGLGWQFAPHWQAEVLPGYLSTVDGHYHALTAELQLKYNFDIAKPGNDQTQNVSNFNFQNWRIRFGNQLYIKPQHDNGEPNNNINLIALKIDRFVLPYLYLTGQTAFAYSGNAAGYFSGMLGAGYQTKTYHHVSLFTELLLGTAGGAGLDIHDGALGQVGAGAMYQFNPQFGIYAEVSKLFAFKGSFHPAVIDAGVSYSFSLLGN